MRLPHRLMAGITLLVTAVLLVVVLAACGSSSGDPGIASVGGGTAHPAASPTSTPTLSVAGQALKFAQCMRDHGVNMPDPQVRTNAGGGTSVGTTVRGGNRTGTSAALKACRKYAPGVGGTPGKPDPRAAALARQFAQCMRAHGIADFPDPTSSGGIQVQATPGSDLGPDNPRFAAAQRACSSIRGAPGPLATASGSGGQGSMTGIAP